GTGVTIVGQREPIWRLDAPDHGAGAPPWFTWDETSFYTLTLQKMQNEVADLILSYRSQERGAQTQTSRTYTDVGWAAPHIGSEAGNLLERSTNVVRVEINRRPPHRNHIICLAGRIHS